jgi:hypothetical protein
LGSGEVATETKQVRTTSGLVVDIFGMTWKQKVEKIKKSLEENGIESNEINFIRSVVRKESPACPDNFMVCAKLENNKIYEANGKFSVKSLIEKLAK